MFKQEVQPVSSISSRGIRWCKGLHSGTIPLACKHQKQCTKRFNDLRYHYVLRNDTPAEQPQHTV